MVLTILNRLGIRLVSSVPVRIAEYSKHISDGNTNVPSGFGLLVGGDTKESFVPARCVTD